MDQLGRTLLQRIKDLLTVRPDVATKDFFPAIGQPTPSWRSEFMAGKRTTNDLRLVVRMARFFGVPTGFLLGEAVDVGDAQTLSLLSAWKDLDDLDRKAVLRLALELKLRRSPPVASSLPPPPDETNEPTTNTKPRGATPHRKIR